MSEQPNELDELAVQVQAMIITPKQFIDKVETYCQKREIEARILGLKEASDLLDELHQGTEGAGFVHYGEMGEALDKRLAQLSKSALRKGEK